MQPERGIANTVVTAWLNLLTQDKVQLFIKTYFHSVQTLNLLSFLIKKTKCIIFPACMGGEKKEQFKPHNVVKYYGLKCLNCF